MFAMKSVRGFAGGEYGRHLGRVGECLLRSYRQLELKYLDVLGNSGHPRGFSGRHGLFARSAQGFGSRQSILPTELS